MNAISRGKMIAGMSAASALFPTIARAQSPALTKVRIGGIPIETYAEPYYALDQGFFARAGLDVEITRFPNAGAIAQAAAGGAIDIGLADMIQLAHAVTGGVPLAFFAGGPLYTSEVPTHFIIAAKNGSIQTAKDLEGQTLSVTALASLSEIGAREWLRVNGADASKVKFVELTFPAMAPAVLRGTIAAAFVGEPFLSAAGSDVRRIGKPYDAIAKNFYIASWFTTKGFASANADVLRRFGRAMYDTARWANTHHAESAVILAKYSKADVAVVNETIRSMFATSLDPKLMQPVLDLAAKYKVLDHRFMASDLTIDV